MASPSQLINKTRSEICEKLIASKQRLNLPWESIAKDLNMSPVFVASVCHGQNSIPKEAGIKLLQILQVDSNAEADATILAQPPLKGQQDNAEVNNDPFMNRMNEMTKIYGLAIKEVVQEKFGDGIMSAIDFTVGVDKEENPAGDRVKLTLSGKFLPFKPW